MKIIRPDNLKEFSLCVNVIDTHLSEWKNGDRFDKFRKLRRPFSALFFILSDLESVYREIDENGTEIRKIHCQKGDILYIPENTQPYPYQYGEKRYSQHKYDNQGNCLKSRF